MSEHVKHFEPKIKKLQEKYRAMAAEDLPGILLGFIHRPGWTTLIDVQFVDAMLDSVADHLEGVDKTHKALVKIADQIGKK
jgi:hypothetical protein